MKLGNQLRCLLNNGTYIYNQWTLPVAAKDEVNLDRKGLPSNDPGLERAVEEAVEWIKRAQDRSLTQDGGVARHYSLVKGWAASYPETTGYIAPTILAYADLKERNGIGQRTTRMLNWLVSIQFPTGGFQGGLVNSTPRVPVTFNTGQILLGLAAGALRSDRYSEPMRRAADWLVSTQEPDGCWRKFPTPFAMSGEKAYDTHVAWGLFEAARVAPNQGYAEAGMANVRWALQHQRPNGWFEKCCLTDPTRPLTHTLGYTLRGILEAYLFSQDHTLLVAARRTADGVMTALRNDGYLPGRLLANWRPGMSEACLTGSAQIAYCWLLLYELTGDLRYRTAGISVNKYVRRTVRMDGPDGIRGGVKGSFPVDGEYGRYEYLSWAAKFFIDSNLLEAAIRKRERIHDV